MSVLAYVRSNGAAVTYVDGTLAIIGQGEASYHGIALLDSRDGLTWASPQSCEWFYSPAVRKHFDLLASTPVPRRRSAGSRPKPSPDRSSKFILFVVAAIVAIYAVHNVQQLIAPSSSGQTISTPYMDRPAVSLSPDAYRASVSTVRSHLSAGMRVVQVGLNSHDDGQVREGLDAVSACYAEAGAIAPPPSMGAQHENLMQALSGYQHWAHTMRLATQTTSADERDQLMGTALSILKQSTSDMDSALVSIGPS